MGKGKGVDRNTVSLEYHWINPEQYCPKAQSGLIYFGQSRNLEEQKEMVTRNRRMQSSGIVTSSDSSKSTRPKLFLKRNT